MLGGQRWEQAGSRGPQGSQPVLTLGQVVLPQVMEQEVFFLPWDSTFEVRQLREGKPSGVPVAALAVSCLVLVSSTALLSEQAEPSGTYWQIFLSKRFQLMMVGMCWWTSSLPVLHRIFCQNPEILQGELIKGAPLWWCRKLFLQNIFVKRQSQDNVKREGWIKCEGGMKKRSVMEGRERDTNLLRSIALQSS